MPKSQRLDLRQILYALWLAKRMSMTSEQAKQVAIAEIAPSLKLQLVNEIPEGFYNVDNVNPEEWYVFFVDDTPHVGASHYVAVNKESGKFSDLGLIGE